MRKPVKIITITISVLLLLATVAGFVAANFFYSLALDPTVDKTAVLTADHNRLDPRYMNEEALKQRQQWFEQSGYTERNMQSYDGYNLHAYEIKNPASQNRWVLLAHGYLGSGVRMAGAARQFYDMGFNVLMPDLRGSGQSDCPYIAMGWDDRLDMVAWINLIVEEYPQAEIVLYGVSMGGATVMMTSGEELPPNVKTIVEDCGYTSAKEEFAYQLKQIFGIPSFPMMNLASLVTKMRAGYWLGEADALQQVKKSKTPMLFIHGTEDTFVPSDMVYELYAAANVEKELYVVEGAGHGMSSAVAGQVYWDTVKAFIGRFIEL